MFHLIARPLREMFRPISSFHVLRPDELVAIPWPTSRQGSVFFCGNPQVILHAEDSADTFGPDTGDVLI